MQAATSSGDVEARGRCGSVRTSSGDIVAELTGEARLSTSSGAVTALLRGGGIDGEQRWRQ